mmetsp:Transcript_74632/g.155619  ORF Transcript_74632/g.155619 Transcript_74632/m.155619 type:complete len:219 (+) Transcript_74632:502-1158(+)|eukprot:CAMPEP_0206434636 /NCGR_PEP_ID=MMETSP0324_2-20121206/9306_1 /ASSEMBLY_ACC=CAM_ASM_000836 /TAXON_ID=2866 /ORGANISM="Crypthecodinium cohnii, Strain Seligo" /LENGTH=218 /DNA_ID=CAMNT_0053901249 /DNA_START=466 /DNA_END=1122 /DNA_ORIENTATION=+
MSAWSRAVPRHRSTRCTDFACDFAVVSAVRKCRLAAASVPGCEGLHVEVGVLGQMLRVRREALVELVALRFLHALEQLGGFFLCRVAISLPDNFSPLVTKLPLEAHLVDAGRGVRVRLLGLSDLLAPIPNLGAGEPLRVHLSIWAHARAHGERLRRVLAVSNVHHIHATVVATTPAEVVELLHDRSEVSEGAAPEEVHRPTAELGEGVPAPKHTSLER